MVAVPAGPRIQHRDVWVDVHPEEYPGFSFRMWANHPSGLFLAVGRASLGLPGAETEAVAALRQIVVEHNGWVAEDGTPFPPATSAEFWGAIMPNELAALIITRVQMQAGVLPNLLAQTRRR